MSAYVRGALTFVLIAAIACALAWIGGYNFDIRSPDVAFATGFVLIVAIVASAIVFMESSE